MRDFQRNCLQALEEEGIPAGITLDWREELEGSRLLGSEPADVIVCASFGYGGRAYELYVYVDEAAAMVDGDWFIFERPDFRSDVGLIGCYVQFLRRCLENEPPVRASLAARRRARRRS